MVNENAKTLSELFEDILNRGNCILLVGAGISKAAPTYLPLAGEYKVHFLKYLCQGTEILEHLYNTHWKKQYKVSDLKNCFESIRFEQFNEVISSNTTNYLSIFEDIS